MNSELVFRRALSIAKARDITMDFLLQYPITSIPSSLFHEDGQMRKTRKDDLAHKLEEKVTSEVILPAGNASETIYIRDAMAIIQSINGDQFKTFDNLAAAYMHGLLQCFSEANTVVDVYDRYDNMESVKQGERERRQAAGPGSRQYQVISGRSIPPWRIFLNNPKDKAALIAFLCQYIADHSQVHLMQHTTQKTKGRACMLLNNLFHICMIRKCMTQTLVNSEPDLPSSRIDH